MKPYLRLSMLLSALALTALLPARAEAASQILGLLASNGVPTPLRCEDGVCRGVVASFCLQQERSAPTLDSKYRLAPGGGLILLARRADGSVLRLSGEDVVAIRIDTGFTSVGISLPEARLKALGAVSAAVEVAPLTSILPEPLAGDPDPQSPQEVAQAVGPVRRLAGEVIDRSNEESDAARVVGLLINALPPERAGGPVGLDQLFHRVLATMRPGRIGAAGFAAAERIAKDCQSFPANSAALGFCLEVQRNILMGALNQELWESLGGS
jgi:hypothetical protein